MFQIRGHNFIYVSSLSKPCCRNISTSDGSVEYPQYVLNGKFENYHNFIIEIFLSETMEC